MACHLKLILKVIWGKLIWKVPRQEVGVTAGRGFALPAGKPPVENPLESVLWRDLSVFWGDWRLLLSASVNRLPHVVSSLWFGAFVGVKWVWQSVTSSARLLIYWLKAEQRPALSLWLPSDKLEIKSCFCWKNENVFFNSDWSGGWAD